MFEPMISDLQRAALGAKDPQQATEAVSQALAPWLQHELPSSLCEPGGSCYARHLIHCDPEGRWCAVAIVLQPGQSTPIHNHTTWGVIGVVQGREREVRYRRSEAGVLEELPERFNGRGHITTVIPPRDIHRIEGACEHGGVTVSIHVYGGDADRVTAAVFEQAGLQYAGPCKTTRPI